MNPIRRYPAKHIILVSEGVLLRLDVIALGHIYLKVGDAFEKMAIFVH
ncbi:hypothetical protein HYW59_03965 [Candidatus Kaiserbacteria bacterium]|nr:hypothetical protein [Candidatus Kaiserbacteria bacterium]